MRMVAPASISRADCPVYMLHEASAAAAASRHCSRPESFNPSTTSLVSTSVVLQYRILEELQFREPAFWSMADSGATLNVVWDTNVSFS
jgi:hypothetical protein